MFNIHTKQSEHVCRKWTKWVLINDSIETHQLPITTSKLSHYTIIAINQVINKSLGKGITLLKVIIFNCSRNPVGKMMGWKWFSIVFKSSVKVMTEVFTLVVWRWKLPSTRSTGYSADSEMAFRYGGWLRIWNNQSRTWLQVALQRGIAPGNFPTRDTVKTMGAGCWMVKTAVDKKIDLLVLLPHVKQMNKINCLWLKWSNFI